MPHGNQPSNGLRDYGRIARADFNLLPGRTILAVANRPDNLLISGDFDGLVISADKRVSIFQSKRIDCTVMAALPNDFFLPVNLLNSPARLVGDQDGHDIR